MLGEPDTTKNFLIFVTDGFSMLAFSAIVGAFGVANKVLSAPVFSWSIMSPEGGPVVSDTHAMVVTRKGIPSGGEDRAGRTRVVVLLSGTDQPFLRRALVSCVRKELALGAKVMAFGGATMLLAEAGLLRGRRCAVHWKEFGVATERFPTVHFTKAYYEIDGPFHTCAGEMSTFDLCLRMLELDFGRHVAEQVTGEMLLGPWRGAADRQKPPIHLKLERAGSPLLAVIDLMENNLAEPVDIKSLLATAQISRRQIERLFERDMGMSPKKFYLKLRLDRARELLRYSSMPIVDVAIATGFISPSHFSKTFRVCFGHSPGDCRRDDCPEEASFLGTPISFRTQ